MGTWTIKDKESCIWGGGLSLVSALVIIKNILLWHVYIYLGFLFGFLSLHFGKMSPYNPHNDF